MHLLPKLRVLIKKFNKTKGKEMNSEMDKPMYLEDEKQPRDESFLLYQQFLKLNELEQDIFFDLFIRRQTKHQGLERNNNS